MYSCTADSTPPYVWNLKNKPWQTPQGTRCWLPCIYTQRLAVLNYTMNHFISPYSYDMKCYQCQRGLLANIIMYNITVAYIPLTAFLVIVVVFHIIWLQVVSVYLRIMLFAVIPVYFALVSCFIAFLWEKGFLTVKRNSLNIIWNVHGTITHLVNLNTW